MARPKGSNRRALLAAIEVLTEQWEMVAEDAARLSRRHKAPLPTEAEIETFKQDFSQSLTADAKEIDKWLKGRTLTGYSLARLEWIEAFHSIVGESDDLSEDGPSFSVPKSLEHHPWWQWYAGIRGDPPADFPPDLNWRVCLHRYFLTIR